VQVAANGPHHHLTAIQPDQDVEGHAFGPLDFGSVLLHRRLHGEGGIAGAHGMVLVRNRRPKQRHDAITHDLIDGALAAVHGVHHAFEHRIQQRARLFRVAVGQQLHRAFEVGKEHRDLLALTFQGRARGQDLLHEMRGGVAAGGLRVSSQRGGARVARGWHEGRATVATKLELGRIGIPAPGTRSRHGRATLTAKLQPFGVVEATARAAHGCTLWHEHANS
jgi:hypothetical protein